jgi:hypothetical protein
MRTGWVQITDDLSPFHRQLIAIIPKYASIAVAEMVLPADRYALPIEERALLPACADCGVVAGRSCGSQEEPLVSLGAAPVGNDDATVNLDDVLTEAFKSPSFQKRLEEIVGLVVKRRQPVMHRQPLQKAKPHSIEFRATGRAGMIETIQIRPERYFRVEKVAATDSLDGRGSKIVEAFVGCRLQPRIWEAGPLASGLRWDTCDSVFAITLQVKFIADCEFLATLSGKAL